MIEDRDLRTLADPDSGPPIPPPPLDTVVARGRRLRRRRHALHALGAVTVIVGLAGAGLAVRGAESGDPEVTAADDPSTPASDASGWPSSPPPPTDCEMRAAADVEEVAGAEDVETWDVFVASDSTSLSLAEVPEDMRVIPTWTPDGEEITTVTGMRWTDPCPDRAPAPADPALVLAASGADLTGRISVDGPLPSRWGEGLEREPTQLRGQDAILVHTDGPAFIWTDPDGWSWWLSANEQVNESTLRAVGEALELDSSPQGDDPVATLAPEDMPQGFEVRWQAQGTPTPLGPETTKWSVVVGEQQEVTRGVVCQLEVETPVGESSLDMATYEGEVVTVNGQEAAWTTFMDQPVVVWEVAPGVRAGANCSLWDDSGVHPMDLDTHLRFAESVQPVAPDDPRLP